uniref:Chemokine interleukin-8-like domain-containing protein n=1 Tax=Paramormyrops kingsleyae TaxID=1676925 RepID=A0A3B3RCN5_9TELE
FANSSLSSLLLIDEGQIIVNLKGLIRHFPLILLSLVNFIKPANIEKIEVHSPSFSCQKMEIIVTMKNGEERKCLNPESKFAKNFIKNSQRQKRYQLQCSNTVVILSCFLQILLFFLKVIFVGLAM